MQHPALLHIFATPSRTAHATTKMRTKILICLFVLSKTTLAQINGEFWWLSDKVAKLTGNEPSPPKFEQLSEFDTDESAKIIFREGPLPSTEDRTESDKSNINSLEFNSIVWPDDKTLTKKPAASYPNRKPNRFTFVSSLNPVTTTTQKVISKPTEDVFLFKFPEDDNFIEYPLKTDLQELSTSQNSISNSMAKPTSKDDSKDEPTTENIIKEKNETRDFFSFQFPKDDNLLWIHANTTEAPKATVAHIDDNENVFNNETSLIGININSESICSFIKKNDCYRKNGIIYNQEK